MTDKQGKGEKIKKKRLVILPLVDFCHIRPWIQDDLKKGSHLCIDQQSSTGIKGPLLKIYTTAFTGKEKNCSEKLFQPCPCPALPSVVTDSSFSASLWARISAGVNLSKSEFPAGIRDCRVVYSPHSRECPPAPPQTWEQVTAVPEMHCSVVIFLFQTQKWVLSWTTRAELHLWFQWSTTL